MIYGTKARFFYADSVTELNEKLEKVYGQEVTEAPFLYLFNPILKTVYYRGSWRFACIIRDEISGGAVEPVTKASPRKVVDGNHIFNSSTIVLDVVGEEELKKELSMVDAGFVSCPSSLVATPHKGGKIHYSVLLCPDSPAKYPSKSRIEHEFFMTTDIKKFEDFVKGKEDGVDRYRGAYGFDMFIKDGLIHFAGLRIRET